MIVRNKLKWLPIPFQGYKAINLFGVIVIRGDTKMKEVDMNHEIIHTKQFTEIGLVSLILSLSLVFNGLWWLWLLIGLFGFYIVYVLEWLIRTIIYKFDTKKAYKNMSFEREAYTNQRDMEYLKTRKRFSWVKYIRDGRN